MKFIEDWSKSEVGDQAPRGWRKQWNETLPWQVIEDARAPAGKAVVVEPERSLRSALLWNAVTSTGPVQITALVEMTEDAAQSINTYGGVCVRAGGSSGNEDVVVGCFGKSLQTLIRINDYNNGQLAYASHPVGWMQNELYWLTLTLSDNNAKLEITAHADPSVVIATVEQAVAAKDGDALGLFMFTNLNAMKVLWVGVGTDGDAAPKTYEEGAVLPDIEEPAPDPEPDPEPDPDPEPQPTDDNVITFPEPIGPIDESKFDPAERAHFRAAALDYAIRAMSMTHHPAEGFAEKAKAGADYFMSYITQ